MKTVKLIAIASLMQASLAAAALAAPVKIGFISTFSGPGSVLGQDQYDGFMLAVEQGKGKLGDTDIEIVKEDDQMKPEVGVQIARQMLQRDKVSIVTGVIYSNVMMAIHRPITSGEVFFVGSNAGPTPVTGKGCSPYFFSTSWNNDQLHEAGGELTNKMGFKNVYLMAANYQAGKDALEGFKRTYKGKVIGETYTQVNQPDYSVEIANLAAAKPDAIYVFYPGGMGVNFTKQYQQAGLSAKIPMLSSSTIDGSTLPALQEAALGAVTSSSYSPDLDNPANKQFAEAYRKKYNREPSLYAAQSYDAARLLASALKKTKGNVADKEAFRAALKAADFQSVRGYFAYNTNQFPIAPFYRVDVVKGADGKVAFATKGTTFERSKDSYASQCEMK
ncbi:ABC transporter substrate-binding protein [Pigmentiphaga litoralis]|uniref:Branched-chain amino acid transport system substrate-binding protein n=1 Tax=Pigmentiphaga litoralis TaxID=516702 RepID=A0A7Y9IUV4_9BURK|nr:ABC transporter substrate-binding protein [Pigmentiphaga litoralis]NYE23458.1 branched-chain amino acid transport system substrate-binding protein [Pigmentiphaga litoralis]NYE82928.1 branched-chain amino acid transport system substrate-binding protein [Pigmentiphaga litoralis]